MKTEIEAKIAALEASLAVEKAKLESFLANVPAELHDLEMAAWDKIKAFFASL